MTSLADTPRGNFRREAFYQAEESFEVYAWQDPSGKKYLVGKETGLSSRYYVAQVAHVVDPFYDGQPLFHLKEMNVFNGREVVEAAKVMFKGGKAKAVFEKAKKKGDFVDTISDDMENPHQYRIVHDKPEGFEPFWPK